MDINVNYLGHIISIPEGFPYLVTEQDGEVWAFMYKPVPNHKEGYWDSSLLDITTAKFIAVIDLEDRYWWDTLMEVADCEVK